MIIRQAPLSTHGNHQLSPILQFSLHTMRHILLHPQLRSALPKSVQRDLRSQIWLRFKSHVPRPSKRHEPATPESKDVNATPSPTRPPTSTATAAKTNLRKGNKQLSELLGTGYMEADGEFRSPGAHTGLLWRNWPSNVFGHAEGDNNFAVWCCMFNCSTVMLHRG